MIRLMNTTTTDPVDSSRQESFQSFRLRTAGDGVDAGRSQENRQKKRSKLSQTLDIFASSSSRSTSAKPKPKPGKKPDPSAPKITRPCSECGKQFWSWKALFGHMRCHPERQWRGINPPASFRRPASPRTPDQVLGTKMTKEDHEVASCLVLLASGFSSMDSHFVTFDQDEPKSDNTILEPSMEGDFRFECSSCKKVFGSHQALGGHRASHKNVKGCFAIGKNDGDGEDEDPIGGGEGEVKESGEDEMLMMDTGHKCSICLKVFSSGQALGGHKRCHWEKGDEPFPSQDLNSYSLDLNLPAPIDNNGGSSSSDFGLNLRLGI